MSKSTFTTAVPEPAPTARHRSGAVARMLRMPVATLRVWERRYHLTQAELSASGQRLYSAGDVQRLALLKRLSDLGHAIGSLAALDMRQLHDVSATHARALTQARSSTASTATCSSWRLAVVGGALFKRLQSPALLCRLSRPLHLLGPFDSATQAEAALRGAQVDLLLVQASHLHADWLATWQARAPGLATRPSALLYRFAPNAVCEALADADTPLLREPQPDSALAQWLQGVLNAAVQPPPEPSNAPTPSNPALTPRRWDDAALADFAGLSSTVACECPRHVAELLMQLSHFEAYSAECQDRSPDDAQLHRYLREVAANSRASFEAALEHIALLEGLVLPPSRN